LRIYFFAGTTLALLSTLGTAAPGLAQEVLLLQRGQLKAAGARVAPRHKTPARLTVTRSAAPLSAAGREAQNKIKAGDLIGAIDTWSAELALRPNQVEGWIARAALKRQIGDLQGAQDDLDRVLEDHPSSVQALIARSNVRRRLNDLRGAGQDIDRAANLAPENRQVFSERSSLRFALSDMTGAMADYNYVQSLHHGAARGGPPVTARPSEIIKGTGSTASPAVAPNIVAAKIEPKAANERAGDRASNWRYSSAELAHLNNAAVQEINGKHFDLAIKSFERLIKISPEYSHARENLVIAHNNYGLELAARHPQEALKEFRAALYLDPTQTSARKNLAAIISQTGKDPLSADHRQKMAEECLVAGDKKGAFIELTEALRLKNSPRLRSQLLSVLAGISESESEIANRERNDAADQDMPPPTILGAINPAISDKVEVVEVVEVVEGTTAPVLLVPRNAAEVVFDVDAASVTQAGRSAATQNKVAPATQTMQTVTTVTQTTSTQTTPAPVQNVQARENYESPSAQPSMVPIFKTTIEDSPETILQVARQLASEDRELDAEALLVRLAEILRKKKVKGVSSAELMLENTLDTLSELYIKHSRFQKAERTMKELVEIRERSKGQDDPILGKTLADYSSVLRSVGRPEEARKQELKANYIFNAVH